MLSNLKTVLVTAIELKNYLVNIQKVRKNNIEKFDIESALLN